MPGYRTTRLADDDMIEIYVTGAQTFGIMQAERYHADLVATFGLIARQHRLAPERQEFKPACTAPSP